MDKFVLCSLITAIGIILIVGSVAFYFYGKKPVIVGLEIYNKKVLVAHFSDFELPEAGKEIELPDCPHPGDFDVVVKRYQ